MLPLARADLFSVSADISTAPPGTPVVPATKVRPHRVHRHRLAAAEPGRSGGPGEFAHERGREGGVGGVTDREEFEGQRLQGVAGEQGGGLVEGLVARGTSAAQVRIIHARQVVMDQRVSVDALQRRRGVRGVGLRVEGDGGGEAEHRTQAFAAGFERVAHRAVQAGRTGVRRGGEAAQGFLGLADQSLMP